MDNTHIEGFFAYIVDATQDHFAIAERSSSLEKHREESFLAMGIEDAGRTAKETFLSLPSDTEPTEIWAQCLASIKTKLYSAREFCQAIESGKISPSEPFALENAQNTIRGYHNAIIGLRRYRSLDLGTV